MVYIKGQNSWDGTGLDFSMDFQVVKEAVALLRSRNICVMLSVGGATYWTSDRELQQVDIRNLVADLGLNGVDIDFEVPGQPQRLTSICKMMRDALPKECYLSMAGWSTGAFISDGTYSGSALDALANAPLDVVNIMAYDAGDSYDAQAAWQAYKYKFKGALCLGFEIGTQGWGGHLLTAAEVTKNVTFVKQHCSDEDGIFVWNAKSQGIPNVKDVIATCVDVFRKPIIPSPSPGPPLAYSLTCPVCLTVYTK